MPPKATKAASNGSIYTAGIIYTIAVTGASSGIKLKVRKYKAKQVINNFFMVLFFLAVF
jgi:hypothetical protein